MRSYSNHSIWINSLLLLSGFVIGVFDVADAWADQLQNKPRIRRPVAIVQIGDRLVVANRIGSVSIVDSRRMRLLNEMTVAKQLDDVASIADTRRLLAVDSTAHELISLALKGDRVVPEQRLRVPSYPVDVCVTATGTRASVASLWSRRVSIIDLALGKLKVLSTCDIPFAPRLQCWLDERHCLVADSFGGHMAVVDTTNGKLRARLRINGHNIRGLTLTRDGKTVVLTHQILHSISSTTRSIISWGGVISNSLHSISVKRLLSVKNADSNRSLPICGALYPLGEERNAAGDPADVVEDTNGRIFVALAGVNQVARKDTKSFALARSSVGRHPTRLILDQESNQLISVNTFDDTLSVLDPETLQVSKTLPLGVLATRTFSQTGEEHFFDSRLSLDGWFSCHSCHTDGHTTSLLNDNFGDSTFNTPKRILSLMGTGATEPWGWNAGQIDLRNQIRSSISSTMGGPDSHGPKVDDRLIETVNAYVGELPPAPGILKARGEANRPSVKRGAKVFKSHGCVDCHRPPNYAHPLTFDVGVHDEAGKMYFNPPSLLGVSQRGPYFHDNRARSLRDLIENHDHDGASSLKAPQINDLIDFLRSL
jgi:hypothetical protein